MAELKHAHEPYCGWLSGDGMIKRVEERKNAKFVGSSLYQKALNS